MTNRVAIAALGLACALPATAQVAPTAELTVLAAGSLREAMTELAQLYRQAAGTAVAVSYGPSGQLRAEIEGGRTVDVFASADVEHVRALAARRLLSGAATLAFNDLCVVATPGLGLTQANLLSTLLEPDVRLATSTPVSDPMGDYTWRFFRQADAVRPGAFARFEAKALKLSGAGTPPPGQRPPYVSAFEQDRADAYIMYCTNAASTLRALPRLRMVRIPSPLNVRSTYGVGAASAAGQAFVTFVLGPAGQAVLARHGFHPPDGQEQD